METSLKNCVMKVNVRQKELNVVFLIGAIFFISLMLVLYLTTFKEMQLFTDSFLSSFIKHIGQHLASSSLLGSFYVGVFGGLFFIPTPIELIAMRAINQNSYPILVIGFLFIGLLISYSINYIIGLKLSNIARKLISIKRFYQLKTFVNRYGKYGVLFFNALPLPSQQLTFVLGVFRYNKTRLFVFTLIGQIIKYAVILFGFQQIFQKIFKFW